MMELDSREREILDLAADLLDQSDSLDEATIDSSFFFRFDPVLSRWTSTIRGMMRALLDLDGDQPLPAEEGGLLRLHLDQYADVHVELKVEPAGTEYKIKTPKNRDAYTPLDPLLREAVATLPLTATREEFEPLWHQVFLEANQINKTMNELKRIAVRIGLLPSDRERSRHAPAELGHRFRQWTNWVIWGTLPPVFPWELTKLRETKTGKGIERAILPRAWDDQWSDGPAPIGRRGPRMTTPVRIRTWAIYYTTRRGGGRRTERGAVDLWNWANPDPAGELVPSLANY